MDKKRIENAVKEILYAIGEDPDREGLVETPARVARMYEEIFEGLQKDPMDNVKIFEQEKADQMIVVKNIPFYSMCEHHLLPFYGEAHVLYIPSENKVIGLSKIARIVDTLSKKPQLQEKLGEEICETLNNVINARGVAVVLEAEHLCMTMRGIKKSGSKTITSYLTGIIRSDIKTRMEAMELLKW